MDVMCERPRPHVSRNTGASEWYTPSDILEAVRNVLGVIELDPASSVIAQRRVQARTYYSKLNCGLSKTWTGKVFLNPPYSAKLVKSFISKLCYHVEYGDVGEAITLTNNSTDTGWFQRLARLSSAICWPVGRVRFLDVLGIPGAPLQGQVVCYLGSCPSVFVREFAKFGFTRKVDC